MKKNSILRILGVGFVAGSIALFAACSNTQTSSTPLNQASGTAETTQAAESSISLDAAIDIALDHAKISRDNASFTKTKLDNDDAVANYEIEFIADGIEYEYEVAVNSGEILKSKTENADYDDITTQPAEVSDSKSSDTTAKTASPSENPGYISIDSAKAKALKDAGANAADAVFEKAEFDGDDLIPHYDIEFYYDGFEYDYEINAQTAAVIEKSKEKERSAKSPTQASEYIGEEAAKQAAYDHAGVAVADVKRCEIELDSDDIIPHYELEFVAGSYEYELKPYDPQTLTSRVRQITGFSGPIEKENEQGYSTGTGAVYSEADREVQIKEMLRRLGVPAHLRGYRYLITAILAVLRSERMMECVTKELYPFVAETHDSTSSRVERALRHAIEVAWGRGNIEEQERLFGYTVSLSRGKPTNSEFIAMVANQIQHK